MTKDGLQTINFFSFMLEFLKQNGKTKFTRTQNFFINSDEVTYHSHTHHSNLLSVRGQEFLKYPPINALLKSYTIFLSVAT